MDETHWTARGALAGLNADAEADERPDWRLDVQSARGPAMTRKGGDPARMFDVQENVREQSEESILPSGTRENLSTSRFGFADWVETLDKPGPRSWTSVIYSPRLILYECFCNTSRA
jgi:hypothetical protein